MHHQEVALTLANSIRHVPHGTIFHNCTNVSFLAVGGHGDGVYAVAVPGCDGYGDAGGQDGATSRENMRMYITNYYACFFSMEGCVAGISTTHLLPIFRANLPPSTSFSTTLSTVTDVNAGRFLKFQT